MEYANRSMNITGSVSVPQNEQCSLRIVFSNANGSSQPFVKTFRKLFIMCPTVHVLINLQLSYIALCVCALCMFVCVHVCFFKA